MLEKIRFALTKNLTMANLQDRLAEIFDQNLELIHLEEPLKYQTLKFWSSSAEATPKELVAWCKDQLAAYRAPREVKIIPAADMPYGMTLKVLKQDLKARYAPEYEKRSPEEWKKKGD